MFMENRSQRLPKIIEEEMFDVSVQMGLGQMKFQSLNGSQHKAFSTVLKAVED